MVFQYSIKICKLIWNLCMLSETIKNKVIEYINHADENTVLAVYEMLQEYEVKEIESLMTEEQKSEIESRSSMFKEGKLKTSSWEDVKKRTRIS